MNHETIQNIALEALPKIVYKINITNDTVRRLSEIQSSMVEENNEKNVIIYFNHQAYNDPIFFALIANILNEKNSHQIFAPVSDWHSNITKAKNIKFSLMIQAAKFVGVKIAPIIQSHQVDKAEFGYSSSDALISYLHLYRQLNEVTKNNQKIICLISPEGHRTETGALMDDIQEGIIAIGRKLTPVVYVPLGITYHNNDFDRNGYNIRRRVTLTIGDVITQTGKNDLPTIGILMHNLAETLPQNLRGKW
jgi:hypothetical protein